MRQAIVSFEEMTPRAHHQSETLPFLNGLSIRQEPVPGDDNNNNNDDSKNMENSITGRNLTCPAEGSSLDHILPLSSIPLPSLTSLQVRQYDQIPESETYPQNHSRADPTRERPNTPVSNTSCISTTDITNPTTTTTSLTPDQLVEAFKPNIPTVPIVSIPLPDTPAEFWAIIEAGEPVVFSQAQQQARVQGEQKEYGEEREQTYDHKIDLGECLSLWQDQTYLTTKIGVDKSLIIHASTATNTPFLSFATKNFTYERTSAASFISRATTGHPVYFRAVSTKAPTRSATKLSDDFPDLAPDFKLPEPIAEAIEGRRWQEGLRVENSGHLQSTCTSPDSGSSDTTAIPTLAVSSPPPSKLHSSVLRLSGPVTIWLHYDVLANVLCQITGRKRVLLFDPLDVKHLDFAPGESTTTSFSAFGSSSPNQELRYNKSSTDTTGPMLKAHEAVLNPGDILFLPSCWPHTTAPVVDTSKLWNELTSITTSSIAPSPSSSSPSSLSAAVNVFFHNLPVHAYQSGRDVYANRDPAIYEWGRKTVDRLFTKYRTLLLRPVICPNSGSGQGTGSDSAMAPPGDKDINPHTITGCLLETAFHGMFEQQMTKRLDKKDTTQEMESKPPLPFKRIDDGGNEPKSGPCATHHHPNLPEQIRSAISQIASRMAHAPVTDKMARFYAIRIGDELNRGCPTLFKGVAEDEGRKAFPH